MKNRIAAIIGAAAVGWFAVSTVFAQQPNPNFTVVTPLDSTAYNECTGEFVHFVGTVYVAFGEVVDGSGGLHLTVQFRGRLDGVGLTSGRKYSINNSSTESFNLNSNNWQFNDTFTQHWKLISQGSADNGYVRQVFHVALNANGELTSFQIIDQELICFTL